MCERVGNDEEAGVQGAGDRRKELETNHLYQAFREMVLPLSPLPHSQCPMPHFQCPMPFW
ncbi:hypothetical protein NSTC731_04597 [Nostoc sp. DSM 114167]|jgi:hypothetical protein